MSSDYTTQGVRISGHPLLRILASFPVACFCGTLVTDIAYAQTADMIWSDFSDWLLAVGVAFGGLAAMAGVAALIADRRFRVLRPSWPLIIGSPIVLALALLNNLVHSRDAWTSVVPQGIALSAVTVLAILVTAWLGSGTIIREPMAAYPGARP